MKIEISEKISKESYYEALSMVLNYYSVRKNPYKKIGFSIPILKILVFCIFLMLFFITLYALNGKPLNISRYILQTVIKGLLVFALFSFFFNVTLKRYSKSKMSVVIDDIGIEQRINDKQNTKIKWEDLTSIIISKYSICMIPKNVTLKLIELDISHKEEFISAITKFNKQNLVVDNSNLY